MLESPKPEHKLSGVPQFIILIFNRLSENVMKDISLRVMADSGDW